MKAGASCGALGRAADMVVELCNEVGTGERAADPRAEREREGETDRELTSRGLERRLSRRFVRVSVSVGVRASTSRCKRAAGGRAREPAMTRELAGHRRASGIRPRLARPQAAGPSSSAPDALIDARWAALLTTTTSAGPCSALAGGGKVNLGERAAFGRRRARRRPAATLGKAFIDEVSKHWALV